LYQLFHKKDYGLLARRIDNEFHETLIQPYSKNKRGRRQSRDEKEYMRTRAWEGGGEERVTSSTKPTIHRPLSQDVGDREEKWRG
jgi:hypothetical protein